MRKLHVKYVSGYTVKRLERNYFISYNIGKAKFKIKMRPYFMEKVQILFDIWMLRKNSFLDKFCKIYGGNSH